MRASAALISVLLPIPGEPPISTIEPGHEAAAEHAVELVAAGRSRSTATASTSASDDRLARPAALAASAPDRASLRPTASACGRTASSTSVFHSPQPGQRPIQRRLVTAATCRRNW